MATKREALEAMDFIINVLKEHDKDLDRLVDELGEVAEKIGDTGELCTKVGRVEERVTALQKEIAAFKKLVGDNQRKRKKRWPWSGLRF